MQHRITISMVLILIGVLFLRSGVAGSGKRTIIIDTDVGTDDLMAIAFLLARDDVRIEAITIANGLAHVDAGAANVLKLLELAGRKDIPVFVGRPAPLAGRAEFPEEWRHISDTLPGVSLPTTARRPEPQSARDFLVERLRDPRRPVRILALGPLTNLGEALRASPNVRAIAEMVIMGGAVNVPGNLGDGGYFKTENTAAEWNFFIDPLAARIVFSSGARLTLVPLDATNKVPIDAAFLRQFLAEARTPLGRFVGQVLETDRKYIEENIYYAWDPLAAVTLVNPAAVTTRPRAIEVQQVPPVEGQTKLLGRRRANARVAWNADAAAFKKTFLAAFKLKG